MNPMEWLRRLYWCSYKICTSTLLIDPNDKIIDIGTGEIDCFNYLKFTSNKLYHKFNRKGYEDDYFCLHK